MYGAPILPHDLLTFDIRPVLPLLDILPLNHCAIARHHLEVGHNPNYAFLFKEGSEADKMIRVHRDNILDDWICKAINSFEHTWVKRPLSQLTKEELRGYELNHPAWTALYRCLHLKPEYAGMYAHYQRINDSIFLAIPKYDGR